MRERVPQRFVGGFLAATLLFSVPIGAVVAAQEREQSSPLARDGDSGARTTGTIVGKVVSARDGEPLNSAQVYLVDGAGGTLTSLNGRYLLQNVPVGSRSLRVELLGFATKTVHDVEVNPGDVTQLDIALESEAVAIEGIEVTAAVERGSTAALMSERQRSATVSDAIGREQMALSPDGDAAAALKRVPGLTVVDDKYAYVRGLGGRYAGTSLNGSPLASPVPDKRVIPLDMFPSSLLESVVTNKGYSPDQPADYAGGLVEIRTREFPARRELGISVSSGFNSSSTLETGLGYGGGGLDFLGFDDGTRDLPDVVPRDRQLRFGSEFSREELAEIGREFAGDWGPTSQEISPPRSLGITYGDGFELFGRRLGFVSAVTWSDGFNRRTDLVERVFAASGLNEPEIDYGGDMTVRDTKLGGLLNAAWEVSDRHELGIDVLYSRITEDEARVFEGFNLDSNTNQRNTRVRFVAQSMTNVQLEGEHLFPSLGSSRFSWQGAFTRATRFEPNTREVLYRETDDGRFVFDTFVQSGSVFHQDLEDQGFSGRASLDVPFEVRGVSGSFRFGGGGETKDREVYTRRFRFLPAPGGIIDDSIRALPPNELLDPRHIGTDGFELQEATFRGDNYDASEDRAAGFAMVDLELIPRLRVVTGARFERSDQTVTPFDVGETDQAALEGAKLETTDVLPSLNVTYEVRRDLNLRLGLSETLARPQLRELAPFGFANYAGGYLVVGNPFLDRTRIRNADLRAEWFFRPGGILSISTFYKEFDDPIETTVLPSSELIKSWQNADEADNYGLEFEFRSDLGILSEALENLTLNANLTLVESEVTTGDSARVFVPGIGSSTVAVVDENRPLQGQSPSVANVGLTYARPATGTSLSVLFNRFGRRIDAVGGQGSGDQYEEARSQLDVVVQQQLAGGIGLKLSAERLLGNEIVFTQEGDVLRSWDRGRTVSLSVSWSPFGR